VVQKRSRTRQVLVHSIRSIDLDDLGGDGNPILAGQDLASAYAPWGITSVTWNSMAMIAPGMGIAFDSANPTGGDWDLQTPGYGYGNTNALGNLKISAENFVDANNDGLIDDPDDDASGAWFEFFFNAPTCIYSVDIIDVEANEQAPDILAYDANGSIIQWVTAQSIGDNSVQTVDLNGLCGVDHIMIDIYGSGAIDNLEVCVGGSDEVCDGIDNDGDGTIDEGVQAIEEAVVDPTVYGGGGGHALVLNGAGGQYICATGACEWEEDAANGTAFITGVFHKAGNPNNYYTANITFAGYSSPSAPTPAGSPKQELYSSAYVAGGGTVDPTTWAYYSTMTGTLTGGGTKAGHVVNISRRGPSMQVGAGANGKNTNYGASGWINWVRTAGPSGSGVGDWNFDLYDCVEVCDGIDDDCDGAIDEDFDQDGDGWTTCNGDCDDTDASINPGATEVCNGIDDDCDGVVPLNEIDLDGDGVAACDGDCAPGDGSIGPNEPETCNGVDDDCDGAVDEGFDTDNDGVVDCVAGCPQVVDFDSDPYGNPIPAGTDLAETYAAWGIHSITWTVQNMSVVGMGIAFDSANPTGGDTDLATPGSGPGNTTALGNLMIGAEDTVDADGDGLVDDPDDNASGAWFHFDFDAATCVNSLDFIDIEVSEGPADVFLYDVNGAQTAHYQVPGLGDNSVQTLTMGDCNVHSMLIDIYGSGAIDNLDVCVGGGVEVCDGIDNDGDGAIDEDFDNDNDGWTTCAGDCDDNNPNANPACPDICNGIDDDCDGSIDEDWDNDNDGYTSCNGDCDDNNPNVNPSCPEACNGIDDDCDGAIDEGFPDNDGDGVTVCAGDCDDNDDDVYPGAPEICNGTDDDCNGVIDDGFDADGDGISDCIDTCPMVLDFDNDPFGSVIDPGDSVFSEYWAWGVFSIEEFHDSAMQISLEPTAWDSENPPDTLAELGTPNSDFGGPGVGSGGGAGEAGENDTGLGNVLKTTAGNTWYIVNFNSSTCVHSIDLIDVDGGELAAQVILFDVNVNTIATYTSAALGDNSVETLELGDTCGVYVMMIDFYAQGAWDNLDICVDPNGGPETCGDGIDNDGDGDVDEGCGGSGDDDDDDDDAGDDDDDDDDDEGYDVDCSTVGSRLAPSWSLLGLLGLGVFIRRRR